MNILFLRKHLKLNQTEFWQRVGVSQSGGSRYENDERDMPEPVRKLLFMAYGNPAEARKLFNSLRAR